MNTTAITRAPSMLLMLLLMAALAFACGEDETGADAPSCKSDRDCASAGRSYICQDESCAQIACQTPSDCPGVGYTCLAGTYCGVIECISSQDCLDNRLGSVCIENICSPGISCATNSDCPGDWACNTLLGQCSESDTPTSNQTDDTCNRNSDCPTDQQCDRDTRMCVDIDPPDTGQPLDTTPPQDTTAEDTRVPEDTKPPEDTEQPDLPEDTQVPMDTEQPDLPEDTQAPDVPEDVAPDVSDDTATDTQAPMDTEQPDLPEDSSLDILEDAVADIAEDVAEDTSTAEDVSMDTGPPPTPPRGVYQYERQQAGGLGLAVATTFHPDGSYAVVLERYDTVHIYNWTSQTTVQFDLSPDRGNLSWTDIEFDPSGEFALLVGYTIDDDAREGVVMRLDDALLRAWDPDDDEALWPFTRFEEATRGEMYTAIEYPWPESSATGELTGGFPVILSGTDRGYRVTLRELDTNTGQFTDFVAATVSSASVSSALAFVNNEFGNPGIVVAGGASGADTHYYTWVGGIGEWRTGQQMGNNNIGNVSRAAAHPSGDYALLISSSGRAIYRLEGGLLNGYSDAPRFSTRSLWSIAFQQEGQRALITGGTHTSTGTGSAFEFRHDEYTCNALTCDWTEVAIPNFTSPPFNATSNTTLYDTAWRPGCDGGLIVGGWSNFQGSSGYIITFQIENGRSCN